MLIDVSYFTAGLRQIHNATLGKGTTMEHAVIEQYIAECQWEFLCRALGNKLGGLVHRYLVNLDGDIWNEQDSDLETVCEHLRKAFADYVFFTILRDAGQTATVTGLVKLKSTNTYIEPLARQVTVWNRMAANLNLFLEWVESGDCPVEGIVIDENLLKPINRFNL